MSHSEKYHSISAQAIEEIVIKGSRFIAHTVPAADQAVAEQHIVAVSGRFADATHNCFALKTGTGDGAVFRYSDDGEPSGTAGRPIFQAIETRGLTNVAIVVTRYFGGTKLGTGGLIRAYSAAALAALDKATITVHHPQIILFVQLDFQFTNAVHQLVERFKASILSTEFRKHPVYQIQLRAADEAAFKQSMQDTTNGKAEFVQAPEKGQY